MHWPVLWGVQVCAVAAADPAVDRMKVVQVDLGDRTYPIYIGRGLLDQGELLRKHIPGKTALIVTNENIAPLYLDRCGRSGTSVPSCCCASGSRALLLRCSCCCGPNGDARIDAWVHKGGMLRSCK